jgi:hypothetical protein
MAIQIATLNTNALSAPTCVYMLDSFLHQHDIDILLVQEVTHQVLHNIPGYREHYNISTHGRSTAIMCKDSIDLTNVTKILSGRAIAARFQDLWVTKIYAPSGTAKKTELERFFASDVIYILAVPSTHLLVGATLTPSWTKQIQQAITTTVGHCVTWYKGSPSTTYGNITETVKHTLTTR